MKTPDEARKCVCPHRVTAATKLYIERGINPLEYMECQADKCMMWLWAFTKQKAFGVKMQGKK